MNRKRIHPKAYLGFTDRDIGHLFFGYDSNPSVRRRRYKIAKRTNRK